MVKGINCDQSKKKWLTRRFQLKMLMNKTWEKRVFRVQTVYFLPFFSKSIELSNSFNVASSIRL
jgi:hypothetical protein